MSSLRVEGTRDPRDEHVQRLRKWGEQAVLAGVSLGAIAGFSALAAAIVNDRDVSFDRSLVGLMGRGRRPVGDAIARGFTFFGGPIGATAVALGALALTRRRPLFAAQVSIGAVGGIIAEVIMKRFFLRKRPTLLAHLEKVSSTSFPSGHSMAAASLYLTLAFVAGRSQRMHGHRVALLGGASALASVIGATRVYLGVHWPTDVLGGLTLGTAWACATEAVFDFGADKTTAPALVGAGV